MGNVVRITKYVAVASGVILGISALFRSCQDSMLTDKGVTPDPQITQSLESSKEKESIPTPTSTPLSQEQTSDNSRIIANEQAIREIIKDLSQKVNVISNYSHDLPEKTIQLFNITSPTDAYNTINAIAADTSNLADKFQNSLLTLSAQNLATLDSDAARKSMLLQQQGWMDTLKYMQATLGSDSTSIPFSYTSFQGDRVKDPNGYTNWVNAQIKSKVSLLESINHNLNNADTALKTIIEERKNLMPEQKNVSVLPLSLRPHYQASLGLLALKA